MNYRTEVELTGMKTQDISTSNRINNNLTIQKQNGKARTSNTRNDAR